MATYIEPQTRNITRLFREATLADIETATLTLSLSAEYDISLTPAQVQSVTWVLWRRKFWSVGAFDTHNAI